MLALRSARSVSFLVVRVVLDEHDRFFHLPSFAPGAFS